jgi:colanic acid biosynthesis protein WcaH
MLKIADGLYQTIVASMPIVCVDLLIRNSIGHVLLLKRCNSPAKEQWWLPGGRVLMNERLSVAAKRKALQECGLLLNFAPKQRGTHELFFDEDGSHFHSITTIFEIDWNGSLEVRLDDQSKDFIWIDPQAKDKYDLHSFVKLAIE